MSASYGRNAASVTGKKSQAFEIALLLQEKLTFAISEALSLGVEEAFVLAWRQTALSLAEIALSLAEIALSLAPRSLSFILWSKTEPIRPEEIEIKVEMRTKQIQQEEKRKQEEIEERKKEVLKKL